MFLELLLDNGILGAIPVLLFFYLVVCYSVRLFHDRSNPWAAAAGGLALAMVVAQLVSGIGAQHFYPRESTLGLWAAMLLMLRVQTERVKACAAATCHSRQSAIRNPQSAIPMRARPAV